MSTIIPSAIINTGSICWLRVLISYSTSCSYMPATSNIRPSMSPVSSPTAIICKTMGLNTPLVVAVRKILSPRSTPLRICSMRARMNSLSTTIATTFSPCTIGMPLLKASARLRAKRASAPLNIIFPAMGRCNLYLSHQYFPSAVATYIRNPITAAMITASKNGHQCTMKLENPINIRVISGSSVLNPSNTLMKAGMTKIFTMTIAMAIAIKTNIG